MIGGDDIREQPLTDRKSKLAKLLARRPEGIFVAPYEQGEIGPELFTAACRMRLEGIVSKHRLRRYRPKTCDWVKVKNRTHPAFSRVMDRFCRIGTSLPAPCWRRMMSIDRLFLVLVLTGLAVMICGGVGIVLLWF